ncbi:calponin [Echinococcus multilocularis]|uniref:Calponin n=1 Tax=Echinococcus multilocularis TaxID=6211 RepID=A0A068Y8M5_ECHMU|nr:calponin [Echinococcus multilocularis]
MEYRATKSGLSREVQNRINEKYNAEEAGKVLKWIRLLTPPSGVPDDLIKAAQEIPEDITSAPAEQFYQYLKSGLVLGYLMACLKSDGVSSLGVNMWKVSEKPIFETNRQRERIGAFINFCQEMGVGSASAFQTDQLYEMTNLPQVVICLSQLGVEAQAKPGYNGPEGYWMQRHTENKRNFTEEQLKQGESVMRLQMGYTGSATASGVSFGARRNVMDTY